MKRNKEALSLVFVTVIVFLIIGAILFSIFNSEGADPLKYWLFYYPAYKYFGGSFYFPCYLQFIKSCLLLVFLVWILVIFFIDVIKKYTQYKSDKGQKILLWHCFGGGLAIVFFLFGAYMLVDSVVEDYSAVRNNEYCEKEIDLQCLERKRVGRGSVHYRLGNVDLDVYQYRNLKEIKENFIENLKDFDYFFKHRESNSEDYSTSLLQAEHNSVVLEILKKLDGETRDKELKKRGIRMDIKVKVYYLPTSQQLLKYEIIDENPN